MSVITNKGGKKPDRSALDKLESMVISDEDVLEIPGVTPPGQPAETPSQTPPADPLLQQEDEPSSLENPNEIKSKSTKTPNETPESQPADEYRRRFSESSREAQILASKNNKLVEALEADIPEPSEAQLRAYDPEWEQLSDHEKIQTKKMFILEEKEKIRKKTLESIKQIDAWAENVDTFANDETMIQKYPDLENDKAGFRSFCMKESRRGLPLTELAEWFIAVQEKKPKPAMRGSLLGRPSGGNPPMQPQNTVTIEQLAVIRKTDARRYKQLVQDGTAAKVLAGKF